MLVIVDKFTKQDYFIVCIKSILVKELLKICIKEVFIRYKVLTKIILNINKKSILKFQETFIAK